MTRKSSPKQTNEQKGPTQTNWQLSGMSLTGIIFTFENEQGCTIGLNI